VSLGEGRKRIAFSLHPVHYTRDERGGEDQAHALLHIIEKSKGGERKGYFSGGGKERKQGLPHIRWERKNGEGEESVSGPRREAGAHSLTLGVPQKESKGGKREEMPWLSINGDNAGKGGGGKEGCTQSQVASRQGRGGAK